tara:strand:- start:147338 stop:147988 length:651 start_codon:yes stop_codon:yes gene_type:complete
MKVYFMLIIVNKDNQSKYSKELISMHQLRKKVFKDKLKWDVTIRNGMEFDQFDTPDACYLMHLNEKGDVDGSTRLIPTLKPYLLGDVFPELLETEIVPKAENVWEATRFCSNSESAPKDIMAILLAGMLEFALQENIKEYLSVSDIRMEPLFRRNGWPAQRLGKVIDTGTDMAAGERLPVDYLTLRRVMSKCVSTPYTSVQNLHEVCKLTNLMKVA